MIKLNTVYRTNNKCYIVIIRNPKTKCYELYRNIWKSNLEDFDYLLKECNPLFVLPNLSDVRYYACKIINYG